MIQLTRIGFKSQVHGKFFAGSSWDVVTNSAVAMELADGVVTITVKGKPGSILVPLENVAYFVPAEEAPQEEKTPGSIVLASIADEAPKKNKGGRPRKEVKDNGQSQTSSEAQEGQDEA